MTNIKNDPINPNHYKTQSGVECIDVAELFPYSLGNAVKYAWRAGEKDNLKQDLEKCEWYLNRAIMNGEQALFNPMSKDELKAFAKFQIVKHELPRKNSIILEKILDGQLSCAMMLIDDWLKGL